MKTALVQTNPRFGDVKWNISEVIKLTESKEFDLLVMPELFATGYQFRSREEAVLLADNIGDGDTFRSMKQLAADHQAVIIYGYPEKAGNRLYNSAIAVLPDGRFFNYQKTHLFDNEKNIFDPGDSGFIVFEFSNVRIGLMICFDWRFPESARTLALKGAQIICHPANLVLPHCPDAMITRALENHLFTVTANRFGDENRTGSELKFIGKSRIISPAGEILAEMDDRSSGLITAEIDPELARNKKINRHNDLIADRREQHYSSK